MTVGERIKKLRLGANLTQTDVANAIGTTKQAIYKYENNIVTNIPTEKIEAMARLLNVTPASLAGWPDSSASSRRKGVRIPVYGSVAAGIPIEAITDYDSDDPDDWEEIPEDMAAGGDYIALRIKGDSMEPRFSPGDVVIVRLQDDAESGDIVIAMINGDEATCKKLQKSADGIMLVSLNPAYAPMYFSRRQCIDIPVRILGRVVELRAKF